MDDSTRVAARHSGTRESELAVSVVLVAGLALVHLVMAASMGSVAGSVIDLVEPWFGEEPALLAATVTPSLPLVVVLLIWTHEQRLGLTAAAVVLAFATLPYLRGVVVEELLRSSGEDAAVRFLDASTWLLTALVPLGAVLGWSIARRRGSGWWPGLLVAVVIAVAVRWLDLDAFRDNDQFRAAFAALAYHVVPAVLAGVACWWLDARREPR